MANFLSPVRGCVVSTGAGEESKRERVILRRGRERKRERKREREREKVREREREKVREREREKERGERECLTNSPRLLPYKKKEN